MKKRKSPRMISIILAVLMTLTLFAACGDKEGNNSTGESIKDDISDLESSIMDDVSSMLPDLSDGIVSDNASDGFISDGSSDDSSDDSSDADVSDDSSIPDESGTVSVPDGSEDPDDDDDPDVEELDAFRLSSIDDLTDESGSRSYTVYAPYTDEYTLECENIKRLTITQKGETIKKGNGKLSVSLKADEIYTLTVTTDEKNQDFKITTTAKNHVVTLPYGVADPISVKDLDLYGNGENPLTAAEVNYIKRKGGTYVYSNNPEQFRPEHVNKAFMRNDGLTGEVYVTFEHANYSGSDVYLGYQLKNNGDHDVYITVTNVGYQWIGTWFGQLAWYNFYNTSFNLPDDYFSSNGAIAPKYAGLDYAYRDYNPRVYQPTTYRLPAGEYIWVIGGTSADAYRNINVDNSANRFVNNIRCANGNVKFTVTGGEVSGTMYCYNNVSKIAGDPAPLGYVAAGYAQQYSGIAYHHGIIDNYMTWTFNDSSKAGMLPVTYTTEYADSVPSSAAPYFAYNSTPHTVNSTSWMTHLNPQNNHQAVGMDMVEFIWHDQKGNEVVIDNHHADGGGTPANTANWMIEYQDHFTFVNQGDTERKVTLHLRDHGTLAILIRDSVTGEVIDNAYTAGLGENGAYSNFQYEITIPAHSVKQITLDYLLVACSYGSVVHSAALK